MTSSRTAGMEAFLLARGLLFRGRRYRCPVCGARVRAFTHGGGSLKVRPRGYCPRCNSKARHRRVWLHLERHTSVFTEPTRLLHVAPKYCTARRLSRIRSIEYTSIGLDPAPGITRIADLTALPDSDSSFDAIVCIHVLEHIEDDSAAMAEMWRVLAPGGVAVINVPLALDQDTYEDPSVVDPNERRRLFGEPDHVRVYGRDLRTRLEAVGFEVELFRADQLEPATVVFNGLTLDEHVFHCVKAAGS